MISNCTVHIIDAVTIKCPECGKEMHRVPEVIDCWFDSGSMPFAQHHYPFENEKTVRRTVSLQTLFQRPLTRQEDGSIL